MNFQGIEGGKTDEKLDQTLNGVNFFSTIKSISLNGINLDDLGKVNLYLEVSIPSLNYRCFTSISDNPYKFEWVTNIPVYFKNYLDKEANPISVKLYDVTLY